MELERAGLVDGLITQNVDGLHAAAGSRNLVTLHGDLGWVICLRCGHVEDRRHLDTRLVSANPGYAEAVHRDPTQVNPDGDVSLDDAHIQRFTMVGCEECGSLLLKPDVVYFGEPVPEEQRERAAHMVNKASSLLIAGSSLAVMSGFRVVLDAAKQGEAGLSDQWGSGTRG